jgi:hypothetical protein
MGKRKAEGPTLLVIVSTNSSPEYNAGELGEKVTAPPRAHKKSGQKRFQFAIRQWGILNYFVQIDRGCDA